MSFKSLYCLFFGHFSHGITTKVQTRVVCLLQFVCYQFFPLVPPASQRQFVPHLVSLSQLSVWPFCFALQTDIVLLHLFTDFQRGVGSLFGGFFLFIRLSRMSEDNYLFCIYLYPRSLIYFSQYLYLIIYTHRLFNYLL